MPGHLIRRIQQISNALFQEECGRFDLTSVQYAALRTVRENPGLDATRLSHLIAFDRSTIGSVLERLEAKAWIKRKGSASDRRVKLLQLTKAGMELLDEVQQAVERVQVRLLEPLAPADRVMLLRLLGQIAVEHNEVTTAFIRRPEGVGDAR